MTIVNPYLKTWVEIDTKAIKNNYNIFRKLSHPASLMAVVKSNAYGYDINQFSLFLEKLKVDWFGVDSILEGLVLRNKKIKRPILVLGYTNPNLFRKAYEKKISITISSFQSLKALVKIKFKPKVHIKIDTGMHRQGFFLNEVPKVISILKRNNISPEGLYTHLADTGNPKSSYTLKQLKKFKEAVKLFKEAGFNSIVHALSTAGLITFPNLKFDLTRIGIGLYGFWPSEKIKKEYSDKINIKPALSWKTIVSEVKIVPEVGKVGYNLTEEVKKGDKIAICPIGYWHGYPIQLSKKGFVIIKKKKAKILGRVSMDMIVVKVNEIKDVKIGDEVLIFGNPEPSIYKLSKMIDTIPYEMITRINSQIQRIYI